MKYLKIFVDWLKSITNISPLVSVDDPAKAAQPNAETPETATTSADKVNSAKLEDLAGFERVKAFIESIQPFVTPDIEEYLEGRSKDFERRGREDGQKGVPKDINEPLARTYAFSLMDWIRSHSHGRLMTLKSKVDNAEAKLDTEKKLFHSSEKYLTEMTHAFRNEPKRFSTRLGWFYFTIGVVLIFADLPLAAALTTTGFNLQEGDWMNWFFTGGIALFSVYMKIYYDEYVATSLGKYTKQFKDVPNVDPEEKRKLVIEFWIKFAVNTFILALFVTTICVLAEYRFINLVGKVGEGGEKLIWTGAAKWLNDNIGTPGSIKNIYDISLWTFKLVAICFAIISGICLSVGLSNIYNKRLLEKAKSDFYNQKKEYDLAVENFNNAQNPYISFEAIYKAWAKDGEQSHIDKFLTFFQVCYERGYAHGRMEPDADIMGATLYQQTERMRRKQIEQRIQNKLV